MTYFVNLVSEGVRVHKGSCMEEAEDRHGPFESMQETVMAARVLGLQLVPGGVDMPEILLCRMCLSGEKRGPVKCACGVCTGTN